MRGKAGFYLVLTKAAYNAVMDMGFERHARQDDPAEAYGGARPGWHALRSRLAAGYAARRLLLLAAPRRLRAAGGSFDRPAARAMALHGRRLKARLADVNRTASADGKLVGDNDVAVAGAHPAGD
jgi:hypothetical protein